MVQDNRKLLFFASDLGIKEFDGFNWFSVEGAQSRGLTIFGKGADGRIYTAGEADFGQIVPNESGNMTCQSFVSMVPEASRALARNFIKVVATSKEVLFLTERSVISLPLMDKASGGCCHRN